MAIIEEILERNDWFMYDLEKKFFKLTLNTFRTSAQNNNELLQKFEAICDKINQSNQLNDVDLFELATEYKALAHFKTHPKMLPPLANSKTSYKENMFEDKNKIDNRQSILTKDTVKKSINVNGKINYRNPPPSVSWDTSSVPIVIFRKRYHWFIANVPVGTLN